MNFKDYSGYKAVIIGTGPSLTQEQLAHVTAAREDDKCRLFGVNNAYQVGKLDVLMACNIEWWNYYWPRDDQLQNQRETVDMWTWDKPTADKYELNHIPGEWGDSFSTDPTYIHYGHSSGFQVLNLAYHYGIRDFLLIGYDMRYKKGYIRNVKEAGEGRHFFGEYPGPLAHWPKTGPNGEFIGLLNNVYNKIDCKKLGIKITNCSPGSALTYFDMGDIKDIL